MEWHQPAKPGLMVRFLHLMRKNYRIIRTRLEIEHLERKQRNQYALLGSRIFTLMKNKHIDLPVQKTLIASIDGLEQELSRKKEELLDLVQS